MIWSLPRRGGVGEFFDIINRREGEAVGETTTRLVVIAVGPSESRWKRVRKR